MSLRVKSHSAYSHTISNSRPASVENDPLYVTPQTVTNCKVARHPARFVLGWVTVGGYTVLPCN